VLALLFPALLVSFISCSFPFANNKKEKNEKTTAEMSARAAAKRKRTTSQGGGGKAGGGKTQRGPKGTPSESPAQGPAASKEGLGAESGPVFPLTIPRPLMRLVYKEQELIEQEKQVHTPAFLFLLFSTHPAVPQLVQLPREPNVNKILDDYLKTLPPDEDTTEGERYHSTLINFYILSSARMKERPFFFPTTTLGPAFCALLVVLMLPTRRLRDTLLAGHAPAMAGLQARNGPRPYYHTLQLAIPGSLNALHVGLCKLTFLPTPFLFHRVRVGA
jgi:hypothetical protein